MSPATTDSSNFLNNPSPDKPFLDYSLLICAAALPWSIVTMQIGVVLVACASIIFMVRNRDFDVFKHPFFKILLIYMVLRTISVLVSPQPRVSFAYLLNNDWIAFLVPFLVFAFKKTNQLRRLMIVFGVSAGLVALYGVIQMLVGIDIFRDRELARFGEYYRSTGGYRHYLTYAGTQLMAFALALPFVIRAKELENRARLFWAVVVILLLMSIIASFARSAWLAVIAVTALASLVVSRRFFVITSAGVIVTGVILALISPEIQERFTSIFDLTQNEGRLNLWATSWNMITENPLWGIGPGMFDRVFELYKVPGFYDAYGHAHNDYLNVAANSGIFTLFSWLAIWCGWLYFVWQGYRGIEKAGLNSNMVLGTALSVCGILLAAVFQCYFTDLENNIWWWFIASMGLGVVLRRERSI